MPSIKYWDPPERHIEAQLVRTVEVFCSAMSLELDDESRRRVGVLIRSAAQRVVADHLFESEIETRAIEIALLRVLYSASVDADETGTLGIPCRRLLPRPTWPDTL
jgi:hypothetical protein